ncbi:transposase [Mycetohabitans sp. B7]|nr:transposase [Mycetohabitans sp. B3]MCG1040811.1 transposase [Mycetohabitans sp. B7]
MSLENAKRKIETWRQYYNEMRPHCALQWMTPAEFARQYSPQANLATPKSRKFLLERP